jgi:hypothetical protein
LWVEVEINILPIITFKNKGDMQKIPIPQNTEKEATLKQMEQQIQYQDMIENSSHEAPFNNGNKFPMGEAPILIAKITIKVKNIPKRGYNSTG